MAGMLFVLTLLNVNHNRNVQIYKIVGSSAYIKQKLDYL